MNIAAPNIGRFFRIKNVVRCGAVGIVIKKFSVLPDSDYFVCRHYVFSLRVIICKLTKR